MTAIIDSFPAYTIVAGPSDYDAGDEFAIGYDSARHGRLYTFYRLGSAEDYAAQYDEDPAEAVAWAKANGHELYWANPQGVMLTAGKQDHKWVRGIKHGDTITFKGKTFRVDPASNRNVKLVEV